MKFYGTEKVLSFLNPKIISSQRLSITDTNQFIHFMELNADNLDTYHQYPGVELKNELRTAGNVV